MRFRDRALQHFLGRVDDDLGDLMGQNKISEADHIGEDKDNFSHGSKWILKATKIPGMNPGIFSPLCITMWISCLIWKNQNYYQGMLFVVVSSIT